MRKKIWKGTERGKFREKKSGKQERKKEKRKKGGEGKKESYARGGNEGEREERCKDIKRDCRVKRGVYRLNNDAMTV